MPTIAPLRAAAAERMRMKTDREVIEGALTLIEADGAWTQGTYYRDADGTEVHPAVDSPSDWVRVRTEHVGAGGYRVRTEQAATPCGFCLERALRVAAGYSPAAPGWPSVRAYNDDAHTTKAEAVLMLKRAAAHLEAEEQEQS